MTELCLAQPPLVLIIFKKLRVNFKTHTVLHIFKQRQVWLYKSKLFKFYGFQQENNPDILHNFVARVGVESSTTCLRYFPAYIRDRKFWVGNPKNWEHSLVARKKICWKSPTQCWDNLVQKGLFFAQFFENVHYRSNPMTKNGQN